MNWYIGQLIVAIKNHSKGAFKNGEEFQIKSIRGQRCNCDPTELLIDVGISARNYIGEIVRCPFCKATYKKDSTWWFSESCFAPLDVNISELTEILEREITNHE